jgi:hypothetical protein
VYLCAVLADVAAGAGDRLAARVPERILAHARMIAARLAAEEYDRSGSEIALLVVSANAHESSRASYIFAHGQRLADPADALHIPWSRAYVT